jgi:hypothetical protein
MPKLRAMGWALGAMAACSGVFGCGSGESEETSVLPGVDSIVFAKRAYLMESGDHDVSGGSGRVVDYDRYTPGGGLFTLTPPTPDGELVNLTADFKEVDVGGLDLSFDGKEVVFSMRHADDDGHYHLYKVAVDGGRVQQLTFGPHDDAKPIYVPGERIAFVTNEMYTPMGTRADEYNHGRAVTQMATISAVSGDADRRVCAQNLSHSADPFLLSDGTIGFSRWEHLGPINDVKLFRMEPDCTGMLAVAGQHGKSFNSIVQVREVEPGVLLGIATAREGTIQAGAVMRIDINAKSGSAEHDEQTASFESLTPDVPTGREAILPTGVGRYRSPYLLPDGKLLVTWANDHVSERNEIAGTAPRFGLYRFDPRTGDRERVFDEQDFWELYAMPIAPREEPSARRSSLDVDSNAANTPFGDKAAVLGSIDITQTSLDETVSGGQFVEPVSLAQALRDTTQVRIIEGFSSEIGAVREFGLTMHEGAAILGEVDVQSDGSWEAHVTPYLPYHLQPIDRFGLAIRNEMLWIQAMPGENRTCGGCHESRSEHSNATAGATLAQTLPLAAKDYSQIAVADRIELPWHNAVEGSQTVQQLLDAKCASCHDGGANDPFAGRTYTVTVPPEEDGDVELVYEVPYLRLDASAVEVYYEDEVASYPASYVSLLYPSAMMGEVEIEGDVPDPPWVIPGSARASALVAKVNACADDEAADCAWPSAAHPEDEGGPALTREERLMLIRMADLGGQYYSRRNVEGADMWMNAETEYMEGR